MRIEYNWLLNRLWVNGMINCYYVDFVLNELIFFDLEYYGNDFEGLVLLEEYGLVEVNDIVSFFDEDEFVEFV